MLTSKVKAYCCITLSPEGESKATYADDHNEMLRKLGTLVDNGHTAMFVGPTPGNIFVNNDAADNEVADEIKHRVYVDIERGLSDLHRDLRGNVQMRVLGCDDDGIAEIACMAAMDELRQHTKNIFYLMAHRCDWATDDADRSYCLICGADGDA